MSLTQAQITTIANDIATNPVFANIPHTGDGTYAVADIYNQSASPDFLVWASNVNVNDIYNAIDFTKYTPVDAAAENNIGTQRLLIIQTKQMNLQNMLQGRSNIDAAKANIRNGLKDAVTALPAGTAGAAISAGGASGVTVLTACTRKATVIEKLLTTGPATTGTVTADVMGFEGAISPQDIQTVTGW